jgi:endoglucanase
MYPTSILARLILLSLSIIAYAPAVADDAYEINRRLGRGVNMGNMLEAPNEGEWGVELKDEYLEACAAAGFDTVRIPIKWSGHAGDEAPYTIDEEFFARIDHLIEKSLDEGLNVILNVHHYDEIHQEPREHKERLIGLWRQIGQRYRDLPENVLFELLNEPSQELTPELWYDMLDDVLAAVRESNPERIVIIGPGHWNGVHALPELELPEDDRRIIATFHYYLPFEFTHQGAFWVQPTPPIGVTWEGTNAERREIVEHFDQVTEWAEANDRPILLGEFGAITEADAESRARWTRFVREQAEARGFSFTYWQFTSNFGAYDAETDEWDDAMRAALVE